MKHDAIAYEHPSDSATPHSKVGDVIMLAKPRLNALVVASTAGGYYMAGPPEINLGVLALVCLGTALVAGGASAVNQVYERDTDRLMTRTRTRPMAEGRMTIAEAMTAAMMMTAAGLAVLWAASTPVAMWVALATFVSYVFVYTPLKRRTSFSTVVGAVPGALPPLIGWGAVENSVSGVEPWSLFLIMFFWQMPHFLAIAWMYREDYARAGMPMLSVIDRDGGFTGRQTVLWAASLIPFGILPFLFGMAGLVYAIGALILGSAQLALAISFARHRSIANARTLFFASIVYLPLLWVLMVVSRT
jgi:protoheme IX farnesyltransferase